MSYKATTCDLSHPVIVSPAPYRVSDTYSMVNTGDIVETMTDAGWDFMSGTVRVTRKPERRASSAHVLRFSHRDLPTVNGNLIEAVILNSHDSSTAFRMMFGVFRLACANGLIVSAATLADVRLRHHGLTTGTVLEHAHRMIEQAPAVADRLDRWSGIRLCPERQQALARRAARLRWDDAVFTDDLLTTRRPEDRGDDLWTVFNRAQESVLRGGIAVTRYVDNTLTRTRRATPVRGALQQVRLNEQLWNLAEEFATEA